MAPVQGILQLTAIHHALAAPLFLALFLTLPDGRAVKAETIRLTLKNGDTINAELVPDESTDERKVVMHPQLGRLEVSRDAIRPEPTPPAWKSSISAGVIGNNKDGNDDVTATFAATSTYKKDGDKLSLKGGYNYNTTRDGNEPFKVQTDKGSATVRYDRRLSRGISLVTFADYHYNATNEASVNTVKGAVGLGVPLINTPSTQLTLSLGPSFQWGNGGSDCDTDSACGRTYPGASFTTELDWTPNPSFRISLDNNFSALAASELKPTNSFGATIKYFPSITSGMFTSLQFLSTYNSIAKPEIDNTVNGQVGIEF